MDGAASTSVEVEALDRPAGVRAHGQHSLEGVEECAAPPPLLGSQCMLHETTPGLGARPPGTDGVELSNGQPCALHVMIEFEGGVLVEEAF